MKHAVLDFGKAQTEAPYIEKPCTAFRIVSAQQLTREHNRSSDISF